MVPGFRPATTRSRRSKSGRTSRAAGVVAGPPDLRGRYGEGAGSRSASARSRLAFSRASSAADQSLAFTRPRPLAEAVRPRDARPELKGVLICRSPPGCSRTPPAQSGGLALAPRVLHSGGMKSPRPAPVWQALQQQILELHRLVLEMQERLNVRIDTHIARSTEAREKADLVNQYLHQLRGTVDRLMHSPPPPARPPRGRKGGGGATRSPRARPKRKPRPAQAD